VFTNVINVVLYNKILLFIISLSISFVLDRSIGISPYVILLHCALS